MLPKVKQTLLLRLENPTWTLQKIGANVGASREYIRQILQRHNLSTRGVVPLKKCSTCGINDVRHQGVKTCTGCHIARTQGHREFCFQCGKEIWIRTSHWRRVHAEPELYTGKGRFFCNRKCSGRYAGQHYGWGKKSPHRQKTKFQIGNIAVLPFSSKKARLRSPSHRGHHGVITDIIKDTQPFRYVFACKCGKVMHLTSYFLDKLADNQEQLDEYNKARERRQPIQDRREGPFS